MGIAFYFPTKTILQRFIDTIRRKKERKERKKQRKKETKKERNKERNKEGKKERKKERRAKATAVLCRHLLKGTGEDFGRERAQVRP